MKLGDPSVIVDKCQSPNFGEESRWKTHSPRLGDADLEDGCTRARWTVGKENEYPRASV
jgi:hypothetical protein